MLTLSKEKNRKYRQNDAIFSDDMKRFITLIRQMTTATCCFQDKQRRNQQTEPMTVTNKGSPKHAHKSSYNDHSFHYSFDFSIHP